MLDTTQLLLSVIGVLVTVMWWSIRTGIVRLVDSVDELKNRLAKTEKDCVTWDDLEKERLRLADHDRRITIIETTCKQEHGK